MIEEALGTGGTSERLQVVGTLNLEKEQLGYRRMLSGPSLVSDQDHQRERSALPTTYSLTDIGSSSSALFTRTLLDRGL